MTDDGRDLDQSDNRYTLPVVDEMYKNGYHRVKLSILSANCSSVFWCEFQVLIANFETTRMAQSNRDYAAFLSDSIKSAEDYEPCMSLFVSEEGDSVELILDTSMSTYSEWIDGEGADIGLIRDEETKRVVGIRLPLIRNNLFVGHLGPIRINSGFRKCDTKHG